GERAALLFEASYVWRLLSASLQICWSLLAFLCDIIQVFASPTGARDADQRTGAGSCCCHHAHRDALRAFGGRSTPHKQTRSIPFCLCPLSLWRAAHQACR